ncbi:hypothetical protein EVAR_42035_1 [Eumeta japonica]|uniref:Uncharacterized protein n=1 Tax=Eumeta variegata TaxID=151549 RepID=A0A4C1Y7W6_EUMVA|nr:hypothetical protein EVAR_42035_1 [Eumeta japonica]
MKCQPSDITAVVIIRRDASTTPSGPLTSIMFSVSNVLGLGVRKLCTRWIPHNLTEARKLRHVNWCFETMQIFASGNSNSLYGIVTGDDTWFYCYHLETKRQCAQWCFLSRGGLLKLYEVEASEKRWWPRSSE